VRYKKPPKSKSDETISDIETVGMLLFGPIICFIVLFIFGEIWFYVSLALCAVYFLSEGEWLGLFLWCLFWGWLGWDKISSVAERFFAPAVRFFEWIF